MGAFDRAIPDLTEAIRLAPDAPDPYSARGQVFSELEKFDDAIKDFDMVIRLAPKDGFAFQLRGDAYESKGQHARAIEDYDEVLRLDTADAFGLAVRCSLRAHWGQQLEVALRDCSEAVRLKPREEFSLEQRGFVYLRLGQYREAIADYSAALAGYDGRAESLYGRGIAKLRSGDPAGGADDIARAASIDANIAKTFATWGTNP